MCTSRPPAARTCCSSPCVLSDDTFFVCLPAVRRKRRSLYSPTRLRHDACKPAKRMKLAAATTRNDPFKPSRVESWLSRAGSTDARATLTPHTDAFLSRSYHS